MHTLTFATSHAFIEQTLEQHEPWVRARLGCPPEEMVVLRMPLVLTQLALSLLGSTRLAETRSDELARLADVLESAAFEPCSRIEGCGYPTDALNLDSDQSAKA